MKKPAAPTTRKQRRQARHQAQRAAQAGSGAGATSNPTQMNPQMGDYNPTEWNDRLTEIYNQTMDPSRQDPTTDPTFQAVADQIRTQGKKDYLGVYSALNSNAEAGGRLGSGTWSGLAHAGQAQNETSVMDAINRMFAGEVDKNRDRVAGLYNDVAGYNVGMGNVNVGYENAEANKSQAQASMVGARAAMRNAGTSAAALAWQKKVDQANMQQDALNDYYNILAGIGGWGGTTYNTTPGQYIPSMGQGAGTLLGLGGGLLEEYYGGGGAGTGFGGGSGAGGNFGQMFGDVRDWYANHFGDSQGAGYIPANTYHGDPEGNTSIYDFNFGDSGGSI